MKTHKSITKQVEEAGSSTIKMMNTICKGILVELRAVPTSEILASFKDSEKDTLMWALLLVVMKERDFI